jgi:4-carboxymuconolactone decarboxylase
VNKDNKYQRGIKVWRKLLGDKYYKQVWGEVKQLSPDFERFIAEFVLADVWSRPKLDLKTRSLCTIAALTVLGRENQLKTHIIAALNNGASKEEVIEVLLHMSIYGGFPVAWNGLMVAQKAFSELKS